ncbi:MAG: hypothetical protein EOO13_15270, partial [Chitinophagaceae bacterium]
MNYFYFLLIALFCSCKNNAVNEKKNPNNNVKNVKQFPYDPQVSRVITIHVLVNEKYAASFLIDNGTAESDEIILDRKFVRKYLLPDSSYLSEIRFQKDSTTTVQFDSFFIKTNRTSVLALPQSKTTQYNGIIGLGFLKKYLIEINYAGGYFSFHTPFVPDTVLYEPFKMNKNGICPELTTSFYLNNNRIESPVFLDLGNGRNNFLWGAKAVEKIRKFKNPVVSLEQMDTAKMVGGMMGFTSEFIFDSAKISEKIKFTSPV